MKAWRECQLNDLVTLQRGFDITKAEQVDGPVPVISSSGIGSYHNVHKVTGPGVIIGRKGSLGTVFYCEGNFWPHDTTLWVKDFHGNDPKYCYYFLKSMHFESLDVGAANPTLNRNHVHLLPIKIPTIEIQRKIAMLLEKFDSLSEINSRRIETLESMCELLYRKWFVNFKFPGHENVKIVESDHPDFEMIPDGWSVSSFSEVFECRYGKNLPKSEISNVGLYPVYGAGGVIGRYDECNSPDKTALITSRGNGSGDLSYTFGPSFVTNNSFLVSGKPEFSFWNFSWIYLHLHSVRVKQALGGAAQPQLTLDGLSNLPVLVPASEIVVEFQNMSKTILELIVNLKTTNGCLADLRDMLLPKLLSGEIDVSEFSLDGCESVITNNGARAGSSERTRV